MKEITHEQLKDTIVDQAVELTKLKDRIQFLEFMSDISRREIAKLEKQVAEAEGVYTAIGLTPKEAQNG